MANVKQSIYDVREFSQSITILLFHFSHKFRFCFVSNSVGEVPVLVLSLCTFYEMNGRLEGKVQFGPSKVIV